MAFRWCAHDGPTLNTGLVAIQFKVDPDQYPKKTYIFVIFQGGGGSGPPVPHWNRTCGPSVFSLKGGFNPLNLGTF